MPVTPPEAMLCLLVPTLPVGDEWLYEIKWDGYRAIGVLEPKECRLISRNNKPLEKTFPQVLGALKELKCKSAVVDGEVVAMGENGLPSFNLLQRHKQHAHLIRYVLFDLLSLNGKDLKKLSLEKRRQMLRDLIPPSSILSFSQELSADPEELMKQAQKAGLEGIVAKRRTSPYEPGERSGAWSKWKADQVEVFLVGGYTKAGEVLVGLKERQGLRYVAKVKAGFVQRTRKALMEKIKPLRQQECPFYNLPETGKGRFGESMTAAKMEECTWVKPEVKVKVGFVEWTEIKHLRHSKFIAMV